MGTPSISAKELDDMFFQPADEFFPSTVGYALTYNDVTLKTHESEISPSAADPTTDLGHGIILANPIISADMDTVTEGDMAIAMALSGGLGIIHSNLHPDDQIKEVGRVKHYVNGVISKPITVTPKMKISQVLELISEKKYGFSTFPVTDGKNKLLGLLSSAAVKPRYESMTVQEVMRKREEVKTISESQLGNDPIGVANAFFNENIGIHKLLIVDKNDKLKGLITVSDVDRIMKESKTTLKPTRDEEHRLRVGATLYMFRTPEGKLDKEKILQHVQRLVKKGVDLVAVSTAHGHSKDVGDVVRMVRDAFPKLPIMAGNVTSAEAVEYLAKAGATIIKVGQGPGSICTTREVAGVGIPQLTALYVCSRIAKVLGVKIIADGGITKSGDIVKALTIGDAVMVGGLLAGCTEAPGQIIEIDGKTYKYYRGMGSTQAMKEGSANRYGHRGITIKSAPEGIEAMKKITGPVSEVVAQLLGGLQSGMGYHGAPDLETLKSRARYVRMSPAGVTESGTHDVHEIITK